MVIGNPVTNPIPGYGATISAPPGGSFGVNKTWTEIFNETGQTPDQQGFNDPRWQWDPNLKSLVQSPAFFQQPYIQQSLTAGVQGADQAYQQTHPQRTNPGIISPSSVNQAVSQAFQNPGTVQTVNATLTQPQSPTSTQSQVDPFTAWMQQQGTFPYNQNVLSMSGWNPATGYNPSTSGYDPYSMPNYSMDSYP